ncbi:MAG: ester cyclase [Planctomycetaceae bacterium]
MTSADIRTSVSSFYEDIWNRHDGSALASLLSSEFMFRGSLGQTCQGHAEFAEYVGMIHRVLGNYHCEILDIVVEAPRAFARMRFSGIHQGGFLGFVPTGQRVEWSGAALFTFENMLISDLWVLGDLISLQQQLTAQRQLDHKTEGT